MCSVVLDHPEQEVLVVHRAALGTRALMLEHSVLGVLMAIGTDQRVLGLLQDGRIVLRGTTCNGSGSDFDRLPFPIAVMVGEAPLFKVQRVCDLMEHGILVFIKGNRAEQEC